ncbi:MAG TPA: ATP-dependent Clp protease ATP-binding subunit, partial [Candidatus Dojkabacteria bacterium]|nr:ATP-dependent Clp protease ATP-binding subunit [Candidatus Dojkabacteria bacterium]
LESILCRRRKNNVVIVGEAGVGKTVLVEGLAQRIASGNVPPSLRDAKIISLNVSDIMAGSKMRGDVEEKVTAIIEEVTQAENTILFIDEIHNIVAPGMPGSSSDIASVLKPALTQGNFRCIGATTTEDYSAYFETDNALARRFQPLFLEELSVESTLGVLKVIRPLLEKHHNVRISDEAILMATQLSDRYVADRYLPDKAIDVLDEASSSKKLGVEADFKDIEELKNQLKEIKLEKEDLISRWEMSDASKIQIKEDKIQERILLREKELSLEKGRKKNEITSEDVRNVISKWTGIPINTLGSQEKNALISLDLKLKAKVIGQDEACDAVSGAIKRARTGISDTDRPWASFLFLGPTGVGKTELAKVLSEELFGNTDNLIQIDMSEMMEMHSVSKLIGSPPGYVGFQQGGWLTERVRRHPHSVILFDEIEKAHPDVLTILLQIMEYGHLMDGRGKRVNFKNTVIILTSNIGAEEIRKSKILGFSEIKEKAEKNIKDERESYKHMKETLMEELKNTLRPELLNRLDEVVIFRSLNRVDARKIVKLLLFDLNNRLKEEKILVKLNSQAISYIVKESFSDEYGARPLRRFLQDKVENLLADYILHKGDGTNKGE